MDVSSVLHGNPWADNSNSDSFSYPLQPSIAMTLIQSWVLSAWSVSSHKICKKPVRTKSVQIAEMATHELRRSTSWVRITTPFLSTSF